MKFRAHIFLLLLILSVETRAQNSFQSSSPYTGKIVTSNGNDVMLPSYAQGDKDVQGSSYFSKDWVKGSVTLSNTKVFSDDAYVFMFDKVDESLYFKKADSPVTMQADVNKLIAFTLFTDRPHTFMKAAYFGSRETEFFEVLLLDEKKYSLVKSVKTSLEESHASKGAQAMTQTLTSSVSYLDEVKYFIFQQGKLTEVALKRKKIADAFPAGDAQKVEAYLKEHGGNLNEEYAVDMLKDLNEHMN